MLAREMFCDKGHVSRIVASLVKSGFVAVESDQVDRRVQHLYLTAAGQQLFEKAFIQYAETFNQVHLAMQNNACTFAELTDMENILQTHLRTEETHSEGR